MDERPWLEELRRALARRYLPPRYAKRLLEELADHLIDMEVDMYRDEKERHDQLGVPDDVAEQAAKEYRARRFSGRHPWLVFLVLPILSMPLWWAAGLILLGLLGEGLLWLVSHEQGAELPAWLEALTPLAPKAVLLGAPLVASLFFCRLARKAALNWPWTLLASTLVAVLSLAAAADCRPPSHGDPGTFTFGVGIGRHASAMQLAQFAVPLAIGAWAAWGTRRAAQRVAA